MDIIENRTFKPVTLKPKGGGGSRELVIPPLTQEVVKNLEEYDVAKLEQAGDVRAFGVEEDREGLTESVSRILGMALVAGIAVAFIVDGLTPYWFVAGIPVLLSLFVGAGYAYKRAGDEIPDLDMWLRAGAQILSFTFTAIITVVLPVAVYLRLGETTPEFNLFAHAVQIAFVITASLAPALLFYAFDRARLSTIRAQFYQDIRRMDPAVRGDDRAAVGEVEAKYGEILEDSLGIRRPTTGSWRLVRGARLPIVMATFLITLGWTGIFVLPTVGVTVTGPSELPLLFDPAVPNHILFAFLGAYVYTIVSLRRRYGSGDLRPKAYMHVATRMILAPIVAVVLATYLAGRTLPLGTDGDLTLYGLAFLFGAVPDEFLTYMRESVTKAGHGLTGRRGRNIPSFRERAPLSHLEGIGIHERTRLAEEGIHNVHALANCHLPQLLLATRIPAPQLLDWVDQAILYQRIDPDDGTAPLEQLHHLRRLGVHKASDLLERAEKARARGAEHHDQFLRSLEVGKPDENRPPVFEGILDSLEGEEWLRFVRKWRGHTPAA